MSGTKKKPDEWMHMYFDDYKTEAAPPISEEDENELIEMMKAMNEGSTK